MALRKRLNKGVAENPIVHQGRKLSSFAKVGTPDGRTVTLESNTLNDPKRKLSALRESLRPPSKLDTIRNAPPVDPTAAPAPTAPAPATAPASAAAPVTPAAPLSQEAITNRPEASTAERGQSLDPDMPVTVRSFLTAKESEGGQGLTEGQAKVLIRKLEFSRSSRDIRKLEELKGKAAGLEAGRQAEIKEDTRFRRAAELKEEEKREEQRIFDRGHDAELQKIEMRGDIRAEAAEKADEVGDENRAVELQNFMAKEDFKSAHDRSNKIYAAKIKKLEEDGERQGGLAERKAKQYGVVFKQHQSLLKSLADDEQVEAMKAIGVYDDNLKLAARMQATLTRGVTQEDVQASEGASANTQRALNKVGQQAEADVDATRSAALSPQGTQAPVPEVAAGEQGDAGQAHIMEKSDETLAEERAAAVKSADADGDGQISPAEQSTVDFNFSQATKLMRILEKNPGAEDRIPPEKLERAKMAILVWKQLTKRQLTPGQSNGRA